MEKKTEKKILGSVAVDSQTGMEHYDQPKQTLRSAGQTVQIDSNQELRDDFQTPNYGEANGRTTSQNLAGVPEEFMGLFEHDPSEVIVHQATRHPIGVLAIFVMAGAAALVVIATYLFFATDSSLGSSLGINPANVGAVAGLVTLMLLIVIAGVSFLAAYVYRKSRIILTNQKVVLIQYHSLIAREVSQINIGEVEDVNVSQPALLDRIFKTGRVTIETAGEQNNYVLDQVEKPYDFAQKTVQMHEGSVVEYGN
ncbi:MAG: PH domain-containing protein [Candidatus Saccharimonadales bacterium]